MSTLWKAVLGVVLIFIFGFAAGVVSTSIVVHHKMVEILQHPAVALSAALEKRLTRNIGLDADQKEKIHQIFMDTLQQRKELQKQIQPEIRRLNLETVQKINALLPPDQQVIFQQNVAEFNQRFANLLANPIEANPAPPPLGQPAVPATNDGTAAPPTPPVTQ